MRGGGAENNPAWPLAPTLLHMREWGEHLCEGARAGQYFSRITIGMICAAPHHRCGASRLLFRAAPHLKPPLLRLWRWLGVWCGAPRMWGGGNGLEEILVGRVPKVHGPWGFRGGAPSLCPPFGGGTGRPPPRMDGWMDGMNKGRALGIGIQVPD